MKSFFEQQNTKDEMAPDLVVKVDSPASFDSRHMGETGSIVSYRSRLPSSRRTFRFLER